MEEKQIEMVKGLLLSRPVVLPAATELQPVVKDSEFWKQWGEKTVLKACDAC